MDEIRILGICGSLRKGSFNRRLLQVAREELPEGAQLELADIAGIPIYDPARADRPHGPGYCGWSPPADKGRGDKGR